MTDVQQTIQSVHKAIFEIRKKHNWDPDKIVLTPQQYIQLASVPQWAQSYGSIIAKTITLEPSATGTTLFGIDVEIGKRSHVAVTPIVQNYTVPGPNGLGIRTCQVVQRQEIIIPIQSFFFQGYIIVRKTRGDLVHNVSQNEAVAVESLREMISETEYRRYISYGFILVKGKSGATYQVFRNRSHTKVWKGGKLIEEVCVRIKNHRIPPTDNVIAFKTMIEIDEEEFKKAGNVFKLGGLHE